MGPKDYCRVVISRIRNSILRWKKGKTWLRGGKGWNEGKDLETKEKPL